MKSDLNKHRGIYIKIGFIFSLGFTLFAFEWKTYDPVSLVPLTGEISEGEEWVLPPRIETPPPVKPKVILAPVIEEVPDDEIIEEVAEIVMEVTDDLVVDFSDEPDPVVEEVEEPLFYLAPEVHATPKDGLKAFLQYVGKELNYPRQAKRMGVQGKVYLEFMIDTKGSITNVKVIRGIGAGCDEEAVRVLEEAPAWKPAKQRGREVKQKITFPIHFKLG